MKRYDIINHFIDSRNYQSFLEIGTEWGETFRNVHAVNKVSVDPNPLTKPTFVMTSDDFFATHNDTYDIIFIDGLHEHNQAYRDIQNALSHLNEGGVIVVHDCLPTTERMQEYPQSPFNYVWTGDVWKAFTFARTQLPYELYTLDTDYGCGIIDTTTKRITSVSRLPKDMLSMTYAKYEKNRDTWLNVKGVDYIG